MIRTFITAKGQILQISIPDDFVGKIIEVIAFPVQETNLSLPRPNAKKKITVANVSVKNYKFNREEIHER